MVNQPEYILIRPSFWGTRMLETLEFETNNFETNNLQDQTGPTGLQAAMAASAKVAGRPAGT